jgi:hypothetical protein
MQLVCQRNSLNLRSFTVQEIAELSEILTVQKNARALVRSSAEVTQIGRRIGVSMMTIFVVCIEITEV